MNSSISHSQKPFPHQRREDTPLNAFRWCVQDVEKVFTVEKGMSVLNDTRLVFGQNCWYGLLQIIFARILKATFRNEMACMMHTPVCLFLFKRLKWCISCTKKFAAFPIAESSELEARAEGQMIWKISPKNWFRRLSWLLREDCDSNLFFGDWRI